MQHRCMLQYLVIWSIWRRNRRKHTMFKICLVILTWCIHWVVRRKLCHQFTVHVFFFSFWYVLSWFMYLSWFTLSLNLQSDSRYCCALHARYIYKFRCQKWSRSRTKWSRCVTNGSISTKNHNQKETDTQHTHTVIYRAAERGRLTMPTKQKITVYKYIYVNLMLLSFRSIICVRFQALHIGCFFVFHLFYLNMVLLAWSSVSYCHKRKKYSMLNIIFKCKRPATIQMKQNEIKFIFNKLAKWNNEFHLKIQKMKVSKWNCWLTNNISKNKKKKTTQTILGRNRS